MSATRVAMTIAGSDSGGGAGIQADLRAFHAFGVHGTTAVAALTAQNPTEVRGVVEIAPEFVVAQARAVLDAFPVTAIKTGMLASARLVAAVADLLAGLRRGDRPPRVVVDPVMVATSGARLLAPDARRAVLEALLPQADLLTPNLPEAAELLGEDPAAASTWSRSRQGEAARELARRGGAAVLVKGGHGTRDVAADALADAAGALTWLEAPRLAVASTHGTGCTLSAAIAAGLALGWPLERAVRSGKAFLTDALRRGLEVPPPPFDSRRLSDENPALRSPR